MPTLRILLVAKVLFLAAFFVLGVALALGHSLQAHSAPVPINVRSASDSDHLRHGSELMRSANNGHCCFGKDPRDLLRHWVLHRPACSLDFVGEKQIAHAGNLNSYR
jgi:hypothetical protein